MVCCPALFIVSPLFNHAHVVHVYIQSKCRFCCVHNYSVHVVEIISLSLYFPFFSHPPFSLPSISPLPPSLPPLQVMFTGVIDTEGEKTVTDLGGQLVNSVYNCTHLVTDKVDHRLGGVSVCVTCAHCLALASAESIASMINLIASNALHCYQPGLVSCALPYVATPHYDYIIVIRRVQGYTVFINPRALGCSARTLLRARGFINTVYPIGRDV